MPACARTILRPGCFLSGTHAQRRQRKGNARAGMHHCRNAEFVGRIRIQVAVFAQRIHSVPDRVQLHGDKLQILDASLHFPLVSLAPDVRAQAGQAKELPGCFAQSSAISSCRLGNPSLPDRVERWLRRRHSRPCAAAFLLRWRISRKRSTRPNGACVSMIFALAIHPYNPSFWLPRGPRKQSTMALSCVNPAASQLLAPLEQVAPKPDAAPNTPQ